MAYYDFDTTFSGLKGKTVVVTGGAQGIGRAVVEVAARNGANVVLGDLNVELGGALSQQAGVIFLETDVTKYQDLLALFSLAAETFGRVDCAIANAAIYEPRPFFDTSLTLADLQEEPNTRILDINLRGVLFFSRIASVYLRQNLVQGDDKSIIFVSSTAGLLNPAGLPLYSATKSGVLGLTRSLARMFPDSNGIRINAVCPSVTRTPLAVIHALPAWESAGLPVNESVDIANVILDLGSNGTSNAKILYVEGCKAWDVEEPLQELLPHWIGEDAVSSLKKFAALH